MENNDTAPAFGNREDLLQELATSLNLMTREELVRTVLAVEEILIERDEEWCPPR